MRINPPDAFLRSQLLGCSWPLVGSFIHWLIPSGSIRRTVSFGNFGVFLDFNHTSILLLPFLGATLLHSILNPYHAVSILSHPKRMSVDAGRGVWFCTLSSVGIKVYRLHQEGDRTFLSETRIEGAFLHSEWEFAEVISGEKRLIFQRFNTKEYLAYNTALIRRKQSPVSALFPCDCP